MSPFPCQSIKKCSPSLTELEMASNIRTDEPFETEGRWWLPDKPRKKIRGTFRFDPESGSTLNLVGSLSFKRMVDTFEAYFYGNVPHYQVILGSAADWTPITLFDCWTKTPSSDAEGIFANRVIIG